jgi:hypothetical protein
VAYTRRSDPKRPGPGDPGVIWHVINNSAAETNIPIQVPWDDVELVYAYTAVQTIIDNTAAVEIDLELNAAGGTELASLSIAKNSGVGTITEFTMNPETRTVLARNSSIVVEVDGSSTGTGRLNLFLYFETANA